MRGRKNVDRPYGFWVRVKGERGPIRTEQWFENRSDRERTMDTIVKRHRKSGTLLGHGRLGRG